MLTRFASDTKRITPLLPPYVQLTHKTNTQETDTRTHIRAGAPAHLTQTGLTIHNTGNEAYG